MSFLSSVKRQFNYYKSLGERAMAQVSDENLLWQQDEENMSIATIVQHLHGNMLSRWTDFLTSDGEKEWRNRDGEFVENKLSREAIMQRWDEGWACLFKALDSLTEAQLDDIIYIRNEGHTVMEAINRQLCHYPYHVGQMVLIAKMRRAGDWQTLSIARNASGNYNAEKFAQEKAVRHFTGQENRH